jgi:DNA-binding NarL/FixJ family response regulator
VSIKILIADDHKIVRDGLRALLENELNMTVLGEAENGRTAVELAKELQPDVVIMDISMPDLNGIEATRQIRESVPRAKVIALSMHTDRRFVAEVLKMGASGYLLKDCAFEELASAIHAVLSNRNYLSSQIADVVLKDYVRLVAKKDMSVFEILTAREREVLQLIAEGSSTKEIAACLNISVKTVETYRLRIMEKLDAHSIAELTKYAVRQGLTSLES